MKPLTPRQQQIYDLIKDQVTHTGIPPTRAEIAAKFGFKSPNAAEEHLKALARKGAIQMIPGSSRGLRLCWESNNNALGIPLIGRVAAGNPILSAEHIEDHYQLDPHLFKPQADFLLRVTGMSMKNIGILDGDLLAIHKTTVAENGQIVVARIDDEVTVKRFHCDGKTISLLAENEDFEPIIVNATRNEFALEGLAVGIIRTSPWL